MHSKQASYSKAFTLIEMIVTLTIFFIIITATYVPYSYYQTKATVRNEAKELAQGIYEARNMAINGQSNNSANVSVGIYFDAQESKNTVTIFSYPYTFTGSQIVPQTTSDIKVLKTIKLDGGVQVDSIEGKKKALFFFPSITGDGEYFFWEDTGVKGEFTPGYINIMLSFKGATTSNLQKVIRYYTHTHIIDY